MKILFPDIIMIVGFILYMSSFFFTRFILADVGTLSAAATQIEYNPVMRTALNISYYAMITAILGMSFFMGVYYILRRSYMKEPNEVRWQALIFFAIALFMFFLHDFMNDLPIFLKLWGGG
jgi:hypothetical protein